MSEYRGGEEISMVRVETVAEEAKSGIRKNEESAIAKAGVETNSLVDLLFWNEGVRALSLFMDHLTEPKEK